VVMKLDHRPAEPSGRIHRKVESIEQKLLDEDWVSAKWRVDRSERPEARAVGHVLAQQLVEAGKQVLDVWAILAAG
jgi:hypothetical protein